VAGHLLRDGMLYVGAGLPAVSPWAGTEPALIDPRLTVATSPAEIAAAHAGYWPSYGDVSPGFRAKYLRWLAGGRCDAGVDIGCVFLFFYGIERRILADGADGAVPDAEARVLVAEVERLLERYGTNGSFRGYASSFLQVSRLHLGLLDLEAAAPPASREADGLPLPLAHRLGRFAQERAPIPAEWALSWLRCHPFVTLRTPATRCPEEFEAAFRHAYRARFGEGMVLKANRTPLGIGYRPASASFAGTTVRVSIGDLPDVGVLTAPVDRLRQVADTAADALDRYSRWVGRTGEGDSLPALALLPTEVLRRRVRRRTPPLLADVADALSGAPNATVPASVLLRHWPSARPEKLAKKEAEALTELLEKLGVGLAPDVRHTGINPSSSERAAVFLLPMGAPEPGPDFATATLLLTLAASVVGADGISPAEEEEIERHLETAYRLSATDRARLRAHLAWVQACPPSTAAVRKHLEPLAQADRQAVGLRLIAIAGADGHVSPAEVKMLTRLYPLLGLDPARVYADVHALAAAPGPVTVLGADAPRDYAIPAPPVATPAPGASGGFALDVARIQAITEETRDVTRVLASVFADEEPGDAGPAPAAGPAAEPEPGDAPAAAPPRLPGLDDAHSALVRGLADRDRIGAAEFAALAERHGLLAGGAVETVNDAAFQLCDEPLLEGSDPLEVNPYAREELFR
jgi:uncharacterized tellurite resistance protein B-like protein